MKNSILCLLLSIFITSCGIYSFTGASIPNGAETVSVAYFQNNALTVQPSLSNTITESVKDILTSQTNLDMVSRDGDLQFVGEITSYKVKPMAIQANEVAAQNRLTISVKVNYTNTIDESQNFSQTFSHYADFDSTQDLSSVEIELIEEIVEVLSENIFNKALANW